MALSIVSTSRVEILKWLGVAAMLVDHYADFVIGDRSGIPAIIGRAAFPLFAVALAFGIVGKTTAEQYAVARRLASWGFGTFFLVALVKDPMPLNILFTFALALCVDGIWREARAYRHAITIALLPLAFAVEYGPTGVLGVVVLCSAARLEGGFRQWVRLAIAALAIALPSNVISLVWWPLIIAIASVPALSVEVPRIKRVFYWTYAAQWPVFAVLRAAL